ncbi:MAG: type II toxin-antitoxin system VapC family toxin [Syntrophaceae bacterium]|nr:type II toxin-antitoxin system VapC family toxin [Pseudomonadota bacterium]MCG2740193.1 type II toxin-antitoxin system VapC family toxin [Syntrophaceae bacterium]
MMEILVDSSVILDILTEDGSWFAWSAKTLADCASSNILAVNPIIYAEVSIRFEKVEELDAALPLTYFRRLPLPWEAAFLAGKCFLDYRRKGGQKRSPLPDFYIGAHAEVGGMTLLTRDAARYRTYFPSLRLIAPA